MNSDNVVLGLGCVLTFLVVIAIAAFDILLFTLAYRAAIYLGFPGYFGILVVLLLNLLVTGLRVTVRHD